MNTAACLFNSPYKVSLLLLIVLCLSCTSNTDTERHQKNRNNIVNIQERIKEINTEENPITAWGIPHILGDYLLVSDYKSPDKLVYIFDKNNFKYITSTGDRGQGPGEISNMGRIATNEAEQIFYLTDHGSEKVLSFRLDSVKSGLHSFRKSEYKNRIISI